MRITTLIENTKEFSETGLLPEHGLSVHISFQGNNILFDTGASASFAKNAEMLDIDLNSIHSAVLSHHHIDHCGGLPRFLELNKDAKIYLGEPPDGECYFKAFWFLRRYVGLDPSLIKANPERFLYVNDFVEILPDVYLFPKIVKKHPKPKGNKYIYVKRGNEWGLDDFTHELVMAIKENGRLVIFTGCSHNGILNMVDTVKTKFAGIPIKAVIGGFHFVGLPMFNTLAGSRSEVEDIGREVLSRQVECTYTGHCTGQKAFSVLKDVMGEKINPLHTGTIIEI